MIIFDLKCAPQSHVFEGWFGSSADYEAQQEKGLVACPICGSSEVSKAVMAPAVGAKGNSKPAGRNPIAGDAAEVKEMLGALAAEQARILASSEHVGDRFADEACAIHLGEADARAIHGRATREQAESLTEDRIPIAPLPFPIVKPGDRN